MRGVLLYCICITYTEEQFEWNIIIFKMVNRHHAGYMQLVFLMASSSETENN